MKKFLGYVCFLYVFIISYVVFSDLIKQFLAPQMQIYLVLSVIPLILMGMVLVNGKSDYKYKLSDLVLILPLIMLIFAGNGELSADYANNKLSLYGNSTSGEYYFEDDEDDGVEYDFSNVDVEVEDANYSELADYISFLDKNDRFLGSTIRVKGFILKDQSYIPKGFVALGRYAISCCAADATFTGFYLRYDSSLVENDDWYEVEGVLKKGTDVKGNSMLYIKVINLNKTSSGDRYVYPCYAYDNGSCAAVSKYNLEY